MSGLVCTGTVGIFRTNFKLKTCLILFVNLVTEKDYLETYKSENHGRKVLKNYREWFPVESSPELAAIVGDLTTDGHVQNYSNLRMDFTASNKDKLRDFRERLENLFGIGGKIRENTTNPYSTSYNLGINSKPLTRVMLVCGVPQGNKVKTKFSIPEWICEERELFKAYVERIFTNDGSAYGENPRITLELYKEKSIADNLEKYMRTLNQYLDRYYGIQGSVFRRNIENQRKDGDVTVPIGLNIRRRDAIKKFHENFRITDKQMAFEIKKAAEV